MFNRRRGLEMFQKKEVLDKKGVRKKTEGGGLTLKETMMFDNTNYAT